MVARRRGAPHYDGDSAAVWVCRCSVEAAVEHVDDIGVSLEQKQASKLVEYPIIVGLAILEHLGRNHGAAGRGHCPEDVGEGALANLVLDAVGVEVRRDVLATGGQGSWRQRTSRALLGRRGPGRLGRLQHISRWKLRLLHETRRNFLLQLDRAKKP